MTQEVSRVWRGDGGGWKGEAVKLWEPLLFKVLLLPFDSRLSPPPARQGLEAQAL